MPRKLAQNGSVALRRCKKGSRRCHNKRCVVTKPHVKPNVAAPDPANAMIRYVIKNRSAIYARHAVPGIN